MVRIRLSRVGRKNAPAYRIVALTQRSKRDGKSLEIIGHYNPSENPVKFSYKKERFDYWKSVGAQESEAVSKLIAGKYVFKPYGKKAKANQEEK